ncbi:MAG: bifunctional 3,4-dihydroxy-2-butanone-4-phosphate synthase/GTP cyclohydrolase II, partial [Pseudomonadota bacterium]
KPLETEHGTFELHTFKDLIDESLHYALTLGHFDGSGSSLVRVQSVDLLRDVFDTQINNHSGWNARKALARIAAEGSGALVLIGQEPSVESQLAAIDGFPEPVRASTPGIPAVPQNYRIIGTGGQILQQLGIAHMRLMSSPLRFNALSGFHLDVTEFVSP